MKKFFSPTLQNKLIASFFLIGLVPMLLSTFIVVSMNTKRLEKKMNSDIKRASEVTLKAIHDYQDRAEQIAKLYFDNPSFMAYLRSGNAPQVIQTGHPVMLWSSGGEKKESYGKGIIQIEEPPALIAGTITTVDDEDGKYSGDLVIGYELGSSFEQRMSMLTDVEINILYRKAGSPPAPSPEEELKEEAFARGEVFYDGEAKLHEVEYEASCRALRTRSGAIVGEIFAGIPKRYGFLATVSTWRFFPLMIGLCVIMAGTLGYTMATRISKPIRLFSKGVHEVAEGNLDQEMNIRSSEELSELSNAFNHMTEKLRELRQIEEELRRKDRLAALGELSAGIAHEIRNPLGIIRSSAQILEKKLGKDAKTRELTSFITGEVDRLNRVLTSFLDFARPHKLNLEKAKIADIIEKSLRLAEPKLSNPKIKLRKDYNSNLPPVKVDEELLSQAFLNLIINACEAMPEGGTLRVGARYVNSSQPGNHSVEINFEDTGTGIKEELLGKIFNPFYSDKDKGSGLGLSIVHRIIEAHNGKISVQSRVNLGSIFTVRLEE